MSWKTELVELVQIAVRGHHGNARLTNVDGYWRIVKTVDGLQHPVPVSGDHADSDDAWFDAAKRIIKETKLFE